MPSTVGRLARHADGIRTLQQLEQPKNVLTKSCFILASTRRSHGLEHMRAHTISSSSQKRRANGQVKLHKRA
jgi:hypothetical protein